MRALVVTSLILVIVLVSLSAYLRLHHSGIGCTPWPDCYGNIGIVGEAPTAADAYERLLEEASEPLSWATPLHRLVAGVLSLAIVAMNLIALQRRKDRVISSFLLALTIFLAWLGIYSEGLHSPAVVMGNLSGGFAMLGVLGWTVVRKQRGSTNGGSKCRLWTVAALLALCLQILVGGLTSANFAASACQTLPDCHGTWLPDASLATAFDLSRVHDVSESGMVVGGPERAAIHKLHRLTAVLTAIAVLVAGACAVTAGNRLRLVGFVVITLLAAEFSLGVAAVLTGLPIVMAVAHNWLAALLLLGLVSLLAESQAGSG